MTTEQNQPEAPAAPMASQAPQGQNPGQSQGPNQGQPQGHRRRRRRRKGQKPQNPANGQVAIQAADGKPPQPAQARPQNSQQNSPQKPRSASQGRFYQKNANPGNNANGHSNGYSNGHSNGQGNGQGGRRKGKQQRRQQTFVGPMDHSYRAVNGNMADGPPSTMDFRSHGPSQNGSQNGGQNGYHSEGLPMEKLPAAIREDAPTKIFCFIEDLFFLAKIQETARKLGVKVGFVKGDKETLLKLTETTEEDRPSLIIFDLNNLNAKPLAMIPKLKAKLKRGTSVIGFLSHLQGDLKAKAIEAGCDTVMPRSAFSQNLPNLLRRHGLEEEVETTEAVY